MTAPFLMPERGSILTTTPTPADVAQVAAVPAEGSDAPVERTFSQADVDRIVQQRVARYSDYDTLKAQVSELTEASASEQDKAVAAARREVLAEVNDRLASAEARAIAAELGFHSPDDGPRYLDDVSALVSDTGEVDRDAVKSALEGVAKDRPHLLRQAPAGPSARDAGLGAAPHADRPLSNAEAFAQLVSSAR